MNHRQPAAETVGSLENGVAWTERHCDKAADKGAYQDHPLFDQKFTVVAAEIEQLQANRSDTLKRVLAEDLPEGRQFGTLPNDTISIHNSMGIICQ